MILWKEILQLKRRVGDERKGTCFGSQRRTREILTFNDFIDHMELVELLLVGRKFSWIRMGKEL